MEAQERGKINHIGMFREARGKDLLAILVTMIIILNVIK